MLSFISISTDSLHCLALLLDIAAKGLAILAIVGVAAWLLRRSSAALRHLVWSLGTLSLALVPLLSLVLPQLQIPVLPSWAKPAIDAPHSDAQPPTPTAPIEAAPIAVAPVADAPTADAPLPPDAVAADATPPVPSKPLPDRPSASPNAGNPQAPAGVAAASSSSSESPHWSAWVLLIWLTGSAAMLLPLLLGSMLIRRQASRAKPVTDAQWLALLAAARQRLGIRRPIRLLQSEQSTVPVTWGVWRPAVLLPAAAAWTPERRQVVLLHELAHVKRADCLTQMLASLVRALYWFNPLAWIAARALRIERERACDDLVLASGLKPSDYASHLLDIVRTLRSSRCPSLAAVAMAHKSQFEGRLLAILDGQRNRRALTRLGILIAAILIVGVTVPLALLTAADRTRDAIELLREPITTRYSQDRAEAGKFLLEQASAGKLKPEQAAQVFEILHPRLQAAVKGSPNAKIYQDEYHLMWQLVLSGAISEYCQHELLSVLGGVVQCKYRAAGPGSTEFRMKGDSMMPPQGMVAHYVARASAVDGQSVDLPLLEFAIVETGKTGVSAGTSWGHASRIMHETAKTTIAVEVETTWYRLPESLLGPLPFSAEKPEELAKVKQAFGSPGVRKIASYQQRCELSAADTWNTAQLVPALQNDPQNLRGPVLAARKQYKQGQKVELNLKWDSSLNWNALTDPSDVSPENSTIPAGMECNASEGGGWKYWYMRINGKDYRRKGPGMVPDRGWSAFINAADVVNGPGWPVGKYRVQYIARDLPVRMLDGPQDSFRAKVIASNEVEFEIVADGPDPMDTQFAFGPAREETISRQQPMLDLASGRFPPLKPEFTSPDRDKQEQAWYAANKVGLDMQTDEKFGRVSIFATMMHVRGADKGFWDTATPSGLRDFVAVSAFGPRNRLGIAKKNGRIDIPTPSTWAFRMSDGQLGLLQLVSFDQDSFSLKVRWKLLAAGDATPATSRPASAPATGPAGGDAELLSPNLNLGTWNLPLEQFARRYENDGRFMVIDLDFPDILPKVIPTALGLAVDSPKSVAAEKAGKGDLCVPQADTLEGIRGCILAPLELPPAKPMRQMQQIIYDGLKDRSLDQVAAEILAWRGQHPRDNSIRLQIEKHYAALRPDGTLVVMGAHGKPGEIWVQFIPIGRLDAARLKALTKAATTAPATGPATAPASTLAAEFKEATVTPHMDLKTGKHVPDQPSALFNVTDQKQLDALRAFFPEMDKGKTNGRAAGWISGVEIKFVKQDGKAVTVAVSENDHLTIWSEGKGDWPVKGNLKAFLIKLQKEQLDAQPATRPSDAAHVDGRTLWWDQRQAHLKGISKEDAAKMRKEALALLLTVRQQLELYRLQHVGKLPTLGQVQNNWSVLTTRTDSDGNIIPNGPFGPYVAAAPENPIMRLAQVAPPGEVWSHAGWSYDEKTGQVRLVVPPGFDTADMRAQDIAPYTVMQDGELKTIDAKAERANSTLFVLSNTAGMYWLQHDKKHVTLAQLNGTWEVFTKKTDKTGTVSDKGLCGPYLPSQPVNPFTGKTMVVGHGLATENSGWTYDEATHKVRIAAPAGMNLGSVQEDEVERYTPASSRPADPA